MMKKHTVRNVVLLILGAIVVIWGIGFVQDYVIPAGKPSIAGCIDLEVTSCRGGSVVSVGGHVTNNCKADARYVKIVASAFDAQGYEIGNDEEYVEDLASLERAYFEALVRDPAGAMKQCKAGIEDARPAP